MPTLPDSGFDRVASFYDPLAKLVYGNMLEKAQLYLLPFIPAQSKVLVIGGGSGWLLEQLILTGTQLDILYLDAAPKMLAKAKSKLKKVNTAHTCQVSFRLGTEDKLLPHEHFNVIITPFLLDLFPEQRLHQLMQKLYAALAPRGLWLFADFWPVQQPAPWWQQVLMWGMYIFFGAVSGVKAKALPDFCYHFDKLNMQEVSSQSFYRGMVQAKVFEKQ